MPALLLTLPFPLFHSVTSNNSRYLRHNFRSTSPKLVQCLLKASRASLKFLFIMCRYYIWILSVPALNLANFLSV